MADALISPGVAGFPDVTTRARNPRFSRQSLVLGHSQVFRPKGRTIRGEHAGRLSQATVTIQGLNALLHDFEAIQQVWWDLSWSVHNFVGELTTHNARQFVPVDTGATYHSIHHNVFTTPTSIGTDIGPTTFYAPWLEYGTIRMAPRPFMNRAVDMNEMGYYQAMAEVAGVAADIRKLSPPYDQATRSVFDNFRTYLYDREKALGDISAFGFRPLLSGPRAALLGTARLMGDVQSITGGWVSQRVYDRLSGQVTGRLIGVGRTSLSTSKTYGGFIGGSVGHRIYQRTAGKYARMATGL